MAERLFDGIFSHVGFPECVVTDKDPVLCSQVMEGILAMCHIHHAASTPYRKNANGLAERSIRTLRQFLRAFLPADASGSWRRLLPAARFAINSTRSASTGVSPLQ